MTFNRQNTGDSFCKLQKSFAMYIHLLSRYLGVTSEDSVNGCAAGLFKMSWVEFFFFKSVFISIYLNIFRRYYYKILYIVNNVSNNFFERLKKSKSRVT